MPKRLEEKTIVKADAAEALATLKKQSETEMAAVIHMYQIEISNSTHRKAKLFFPKASHDLIGDISQGSVGFNSQSCVDRAVGNWSNGHPHRGSQ